MRSVTTLVAGTLLGSCAPPSNLAYVDLPEPPDIDCSTAPVGFQVEGVGCFGDVPIYSGHEYHGESSGETPSLHARTGRGHPAKFNGKAIVGLPFDNLEPDFSWITSYFQLNGCEQPETITVKSSTAGVISELSHVASVGAGRRFGPEPNRVAELTRPFSYGSVSLSGPALANSDEDVRLDFQSQAPECSATFHMPRSHLVALKEWSVAAHKHQRSRVIVEPSQ